jgi:hypothetical protein
MIDFNEASEQGTGAGPIPEDSVVPLKMTIRQPKPGKEGTQHPLFSRSGKGNEYLDVEFEVLGSFSGRKIWQNFTLFGSEQAAKISMRTLRAIVESAKGIDPSDASPAATEGRKLTDFADMNDMLFLAKVGCKVEQSNKDGQWYINNEIKRIITPGDKEEYDRGEFITDKPLPAIPAAGAPAPASGPAPTGPLPGTSAGKPAAAWGAGAAPAAAPVIPQTAKPAGSPTPAWAMK